MPTFGRDLAIATRSLRKSPGFTVTAILTMALGIGTTTGIFSVVNTVLLKPLPYPDASRLILVQGDLMARDVHDFPMPPGDYPDLQRNVTLLEEVAGLNTFQLALNNEGAEPERVSVAGVTWNALNMLGARAVLGRTFIEADGAPLPPPPAPTTGAAAAQAPPPPPAMVVLSHAFWQRRFGGDPDVLGRTLRLGNGNAEVIGVLDADTRLLWPASNNVEPRPELYQVLRVDWANASRINSFLRVFGRLRPGATVAQAQDQVNVLVADLRQRFPIKETAGVRWRIEPMQPYLVADVRSGLLALMGAVAFVLLIACANVANLVLVRAAGRERELVVRAALGAQRLDLVRQMVAESLLVAGGGALGGIALAFGAQALLRTLAPAHLPRINEIGVDALVLLFSAVAALAAAALFGLVPALRASRADAGAVLRTASRTGGLAAGRRLRNAVVVAEVGLAFVLLVGSGLMLRSMLTLYRADPGYDPRGVLTMAVQGIGMPEPEQRATFMRELRQRLGALPGVTAVTAAAPIPFDGLQFNVRWGTEEAAADPARFQQADLHIVLPGYFEAMRTRLIEGRVLEDADNAPDRAVVVVDRVLAAKAFPGRSAVGQRLLVRSRGNEPEWLEIIGVVGHQRNTRLASDGREALFVSDGFFGHGAAGVWFLRSGGDLGVLEAAARGEVRRLAPSAPISQVRPLEDVVDLARGPTRFALVSIGMFAVVAALLAAVGLYGVLATTVRQRTAEIGVRIVFGAERGSILRLVVGQGLRLSGLGIGAGMAAALLLTRFLRTQLVGVEPTDPVTFFAMAAAFFAVAALACWLPARRAAGLDPAVALREE